MIHPMTTDTPQSQVAPAAPVDIFRRDDGRLVLKQSKDGQPEETPVQAACCFPWSRPGEFISLRDDKGREQALIERLGDLSPVVRGLIAEELANRTFVPRIEAVESITPQAELFHWRIITDAGPRSLLTPRQDYLHTLPGGKVVIKDVSNDLYLVESPAKLDPRSRRLLWAYLD